MAPGPSSAIRGQGGGAARYWGGTVEPDEEPLVGLLSPARDRTEPAADRRHRQEHRAWSRLLGAGETVLEVFRLTRCTLVFTNRRLVLVDEGISGRRVEYTSLPYRSI